jgi:hypothetical protein
MSENESKRTKMVKSEKKRSKNEAASKKNETKTKQKTKKTKQKTKAKQTKKNRIAMLFLKIYIIYIPKNGHPIHFPHFLCTKTLPGPDFPIKNTPKTPKKALKTP